MKITDLLKKQSICLDGKADSKEQVIREMVDLMAEGGNINDILPTGHRRCARNPSGSY